MKRRLPLAPAPVLLALALLPASPAGSREPGHRAVSGLPGQPRVPGVSGCKQDGGLEVCFSSPPTSNGRDGSVVNRLRRLFESAGAGDVLRIAMFRWEIADAAEALLGAQHRGARVEVVAQRQVALPPLRRPLRRRVRPRPPEPEPAPGPHAEALLLRSPTESETPAPWRGS